MNRREVIKSMGFISLHALFPAVLTGFLTGFKSFEHFEKEWVFFNAEEEVIIREIIDILLPRTETKSASEAGVHYFLDEVFAHCLIPPQKELIKDGLARVKSEWISQTDKSRFVKILDTLAFEGDVRYAWFQTVKRFSVIGFFTSQEGTTRATDYQKMPDRYVGEVQIDERTRVHAKTSLKFYF